MLVVPAVDLMKGKCVQLVEGKPWQTKVTLDNALDIAHRWKEMGAERLHVIDLDAALGEGDNSSIVEDILREITIPIQVGGGIRDDAKAERMLSAGASQIITGTRAITDPDWLRSLTARFPERIIIAIDARGKEISIKGWTDGSGITLFNFINSIEDMPLFGLLYTNVSIEGKMQGIDIQPIEELIDHTGKRLFIAGGISSIEDIEKVEAAGAYGVVLGMSIYRGKIDLREALERFK